MRGDWLCVFVGKTDASLRVRIQSTVPCRAVLLCCDDVMRACDCVTRAHLHLFRSAALAMSARLVAAAARALPTRASVASHSNSSHKVALTITPAELSALRAKEAGPWNQLSIEEKKTRAVLVCAFFSNRFTLALFPAVYRATYGQTRAEIMKGAVFQEQGKVVTGVLIGLAASFILFKGIQSLTTSRIRSLLCITSRTDAASLQPSPRPRPCPRSGRMPRRSATRSSASTPTNNACARSCAANLRTQNTPAEPKKPRHHMRTSRCNP